MHACMHMHTSKPKVGGRVVRYLVAVTSVGIAEPLDVVEHQPGKGDDHEYDEGDGDEHHRGAAHVLLEVPCSYGDVHVDCDVPLQQRDDFTALGLRNHDGHNFTSAFGKNMDTHECIRFKI